MAEEQKESMGFFSAVSASERPGINIVSGIDSIFSGFSHIDDDFYEELEEVLIMEIWELRLPMISWKT